MSKQISLLVIFALLVVPFLPAFSQSDCGGVYVEKWASHKHGDKYYLGRPGPNCPYLLRGGAPGRQQGQSGFQPPALPPPAINSFDELIAFIGDQPIAVAEVTPHDPYRKQYARHGISSYSGVRAGGYIGGGGYGSYGAHETFRSIPVLVDKVYSDVDPPTTLEAVLQTELQAQSKGRGTKNLIVPATGRGAVQLGQIAAEAQIGKNAGVWGNHTWETARYVLSGSYAIADEVLDVSGFDGYPAGVLVHREGLFEFGHKGQILRLIGDALMLTQIMSQKRTVTAVFFLDAVDAATRQIIYSAQGIGELTTKELKVVSVGGFSKITIGFPPAQRLAERMVRATLQ